jgi:hypothetical protein
VLTASHPPFPSLLGAIGSTEVENPFGYVLARTPPQRARRCQLGGCNPAGFQHILVGYTHLTAFSDSYMRRGLNALRRCNSVGREQTHHRGEFRLCGGFSLEFYHPPFQRLEVYRLDGHRDVVEVVLAGRYEPRAAGTASPCGRLMSYTITRNRSARVPRTWRGIGHRSRSAEGAGHALGRMPVSCILGCPSAAYAYLMCLRRPRPTCRTIARFFASFRLRCTGFPVRPPGTRVASKPPRSACPIIPGTIVARGDRVLCRADFQ